MLLTYQVSSAPGMAFMAVSPACRATCTTLLVLLRCQERVEQRRPLRCDAMPAERDGTGRRRRLVCPSAGAGRARACNRPSREADLRVNISSSPPSGTSTTWAESEGRGGGRLGETCFNTTFHPFNPISPSFVRRPCSSFLVVTASRHGWRSWQLLPPPPPPCAHPRSPHPPCPHPRTSS